MPSGIRGWSYLEYPARDAEARRQGVCFAKPVTIGNHVWIGGSAKILPGVSIGDGAIVGAGTVVRHDVAAHTVYY